MRQFRLTDSGRPRVGRLGPLRRRRGAIVVLSAVLMIIMMALLALSMDTGYMFTVQARLDRAVDAAALAGAAVLIDGEDQAEQTALEYLIRNPVGQPASILTSNELVELTAQFIAQHNNDYEILWGNWNPVTNEVEQTGEIPSALEVKMTYPNLPLFFGRVLGKSHFDVHSRAVAMYQPRDIMLVLDFSASMNDDSEFGAISRFGKPAIMEGLQTIYQELGSPVYGNMEFDPKYITVFGQPAGENRPQISVEYRYKSVYVESTLDLSNVVLLFSNGATQTFDGLSGTSGVFKGTDGNNNRPITRVWVKSGDNASGEGPDYGEPFDFSSGTIRDTIRIALGLDGLPRPYSGTTWNAFIDYCRNNSTNRSAGFEYMFGYANLINYWLEQRPAYSQTPDLWKVSAQPVTALKDAVDVFMDYIQIIDTNDRMGLSIYNASNGNAVLETGLTTNIQLVADITRLRQAGHYNSYTNIGAGMQTAREHLEAHGRPNAFKMIVLMTDGVANWNNGSYNISAARDHVISEANAAAALRYPVVAISLGGGADTGLMDEVGSITQSTHFNVPGGQPVASYRDALFDVFRAIANARPLKLVK
jgi:hypothetical protein